MSVESVNPPEDEVENTPLKPIRVRGQFYHFGLVHLFSHIGQNKLHVDVVEDGLEITVRSEKTRASVIAAFRSLKSENGVGCTVLDEEDESGFALQETGTLKSL